MSSPTIIRFASAPDSIVTVTTTFNVHGTHFQSYVQVYDVYKSGHTTLQMSQVFSSEAGAIEMFNELVAGIPD